MMFFRSSDISSLSYFYGPFIPFLKDGTGFLPVSSTPYLKLTSISIKFIDRKHP
jgi:hypothetical protein